MGNNNLNILLLTDGMQPGGVERHVVHLANGLYERGINVYVAATNGPFRSQLKSNIPFIEIPLLNSKTYRKNLFGFLLTLMILKRVIRKNKITVIHSHKRYTDFIARILSSLSNNVIHISTCHALFENMIWLTSFGEYTIACSKTIEYKLVDLYKKNKEKVFTIYNGIPPLNKYSYDKIKEVKNKYGFVENDIVIGCVGELSKHKNQVLLIKAFSEYYKNPTNKKINLIIVGDGKEEQNIRLQIKSLGLTNYITILNSKTSIEEIMNISDFMILPSLKEGFPLVILEAASVGKPYIATDVGGVSEFIENQINGILVPNNNIDALKNAISYLVNNLEEIKAFGENAFKKYKDYFTDERMVNETIQLYNLVIKEKDLVK